MRLFFLFVLWPLAASAIEVERLRIIDQNTLEVHYSYTGGCEEGEIQLDSFNCHGMSEITCDAKISYIGPPDACKAIIKGTLLVDLGTIHQFVAGLPETPQALKIRIYYGTEEFYPALSAQVDVGLPFP